jgi:ABC-type uncharacterized transport system auxiliary subunit
MILRYLLLFLAILLHTGCGGLEPIPGDTFYRLKQINISSINENRASWTEKGLAVERFHAIGVYKDRAIALLQDDGVSLKQSKYHYWNDSPEILLQERFVEHALKHKVAAAVMLDITADAEYVVTGRILRFERIKTAGGADAVTIRLDMAIRRAKRNREILLQERLSFTEEMNGGEMSEAINLFSVGIDQLLTQFIEKASISLNGSPH